MVTTAGHGTGEPTPQAQSIAPSEVSAALPGSRTARRLVADPTRFKTWKIDADVSRSPACCVLVCDSSTELTLRVGQLYSPTAPGTCETTMASLSALPQPSRPSTNPPTGALPPLPTPKPRKSTPAPEGPRAASPYQPSKLRTPSSPRPPSLARSPLATSNSTSNLSSVRSVSSGRTPSSPDKTLRRTISIASFPQPPKAGSRPSTAASSVSAIQGPTSSKPKRSSRLSTGTTSSYRSSKTPSLLNGSADGKSILADARDPEASPSHSRSSSAQGSCSTSATTFEDTEDAAGTVKGTSKLKESKGNVIVSVRVRPDTSNGGETPRNHGEWSLDGRRSLISHRGKDGGDYYYDNVFTPQENNAKVYDSAAKRLVRRVMEGYHGTVFAYGMTGTGKTFSMQGTATSPGVIPLAITDIFSFIRETPHREFLLRVSYLEIYNERIHDLLSTPVANGVAVPQQEEIKLREDSKRGVYATPLKEEIVQSPTQLLRVIARGDHARRTSSTQFNARSSRSHAVVQIVVESRERVPSGNSQDKRAGIAPGGVRVSTLSLIDLAGSERAADDKERRTEGAHINKSLLTLGNIISKLSENKDKQGNAMDRDGRHLPYRDSKLTRLLQPALSGNSLVSILCTVQLVVGINAHSGETLNTLKFAARAKNNIVSHAKKAEEAFGGGNGDSGSRVLLERYRMEIQALRGQLDTQAKAQAEKELKWDEQQFEKEAQARHEEQVLEMQLARTALKERIEHLNRLILSSKSTGVNNHGSLASAFGRLSRMSTTDSGSRSLRSSASQSTLGAAHSSIRPISFMSVNSSEPSGAMPFSGGSFGHEDEDDLGEFGDGKASLQRQVTALQADLGDKNRYISTLERRLLQARRSSHSRMSVGVKSNAPSTATIAEHPDMAALLREKDMEINELRIQLDDKDRMLAALRSAARHRDLAAVTGDSQSPELKTKADSTASGSDSPQAQGPSDGNDKTASLAGPALSGKASEREEDRRKNMDEVSRMLDEMIQGRVESGHLDRSSLGYFKNISSDSRRVSSSAEVAGLAPTASVPVESIPGSPPG
ncbi:kinesin-like protein [Penicillium canariense]|uniref:Kinesin-like protein KIP2 n=1 Tax=Penicillium canariense TaxID=189055 RepID=A0A9W9HUB9_9EURO|nr:kinesin-like protein [Penicillium canariense]KAJ5157577.1 Kinesin-like protein KIN-7D chloroplastic [Penicillium canariense]